MKRSPSQYTRVLVLGGLVPLLFLDIFVGLPDGAFVAGGALVMATAAAIHVFGGELRAGAGWLVFCAALGLFAVTDPSANPVVLATFIVLLLAGLLLLVSQRTMESAD